MDDRIGSWEYYIVLGSHMSLLGAISVQSHRTFVAMTTKCFAATDYVEYRVTLLEAKREKQKHNTRGEQSKS